MLEQKYVNALHDAISRALDEVGVYASVARGYAIEVAIEKFKEEIEKADRYAVDEVMERFFKEPGE